MSQWFYAKDGRQSGPVSAEELQGLFRSGEVGGKDLVWNPSMKDWLPLASVPEISSAVAASVPPNLPTANPANPYATPDSAWVAQAPSMAEANPEEIEPGSDPIGVMACIKRGFDLTIKEPAALIVGTLIFFVISIAVTMPFSMAQGFSQAGAPPVMPPAEVMNDPIAAMQWGMRSQFTVLYFVQQAVSLVASSFLLAGFYRICLNAASGLPASPGQLFGESNKLMRVLILSVILAVPSWIGFFAISLLPIQAGAALFLVMMLVWMVALLRFGYAPVAVVDRDLGVGAALKYSLTITRNNSLRLFGLGILAFLIMMLGFIACLVGALFAMPVAMMAVIVAYRWMQYGRRVVGAPV